MLFTKQRVSLVKENLKLTRQSYSCNSFVRKRMCIIKSGALALAYAVVIGSFALKTSRIVDGGFKQIGDERRFLEWNERNNILITIS